MCLIPECYAPCHYKQIPLEHPFDESRFPPELNPNDVPTLLEMGYTEEPTTPFKGACFVHQFVRCLQYIA
jgi:hypothetical protein